MIAVKRAQIPVSFSYETNVYVSSSPAEFSSEALTSLQPAAGATVTITDRDTGNPAVVYADESTSTVLTSLTTDAGGNVPGWVVEGSYVIVAAPTGDFDGAVLNWESLRGDGVELVAPGAIDTPQIVDGAVTYRKVDTIIKNGLVPTGSILDYAGVLPPPGFLMCDGSVLLQTDWPVLFAVIGTLYNRGGEPSGTFRLPDLRQRFVLGRHWDLEGPGLHLGEYGGSIDHYHVIPPIYIPGFSIPALELDELLIPALELEAELQHHYHVLSNNAYAMMWGGLQEEQNIFRLYASRADFIGSSILPFDIYQYSIPAAQTIQQFSDTATSGVGLGGRTDGMTVEGGGVSGSTAPTTISGTTGTNATADGWSHEAHTDTHNPPYLTLHKIIKADDDGRSHTAPPTPIPITSPPVEAHTLGTIASDYTGGFVASLGLHPAVAVPAGALVLIGAGRNGLPMSAFDFDQTITDDRGNDWTLLVATTENTSSWMGYVRVSIWASVITEPLGPWNTITLTDSTPRGGTLNLSGAIVTGLNPDFSAAYGAVTSGGFRSGDPVTLTTGPITGGDLVVSFQTRARDTLTVLPPGWTALAPPSTWWDTNSLFCCYMPSRTRTVSFPPVDMGADVLVALEAA